MDSESDIVRVVLVVVAVIVLVPLLLMLFMMPMMRMWGGHMADGGMATGVGMNGATWMWVLLWLLPLALVAGIGYLLYRGVRRSADDVTDPAIEELRAAYARGDLDHDEFEERRDRLHRD